MGFCSSECSGIDDIQRIYEYQSTDSTKMMYRDFWIFIYLGNGMNVKDLAMSKYENIDGRFIRFLRAKPLIRQGQTLNSSPFIVPKRSYS